MCLDFQRYSLLLCLGLSAAFHALMIARLEALEVHDRRASPYFSATLVQPMAQDKLGQGSTRKEIDRLERSTKRNLTRVEPSVSLLPESPRVAVAPSELPSDPQIYYEVDQLTAKPMFLLEPQLDSNIAVDDVVSGRVAFTLRISNQGEVVEVIIDSSELPEVFVQEVSKAFMASKFVPGELNGNKVGALMRIEVVYEDNRLVPN